MRNFVPCLRSQLLARAAVVVLGAGALGACSSDTSRFGEDPFSNPFKTSQAAPTRDREPSYTGSIQAAPTSRIERAPLSAPSSVQARPMRGYEGATGSTYRSSSAQQPPATGASGWSPQGGSMVTVRPGDTIHSLSQRYGVPASAIMQANGLSNANGVGPGRQLLIPTYGSAPVASAPVRTPAPHMASAQPLPAAQVKPNTRMTFTPGPQAQGMETPAKLAPVKTAAAAPALKPSVPAAAPQQSQSQAFAAAPKPVADANDGVQTASLKADVPAKAVEPSGPSFRWPVRGRVISAYGSKTSGASNDGINIAAPEGTDVKASDDGVVAYSGNELKGFGNLVLIRHANGWVTAYAHNSTLEVKRGDTVRRGQVIAKSGSTGNVTSPQLHFEVRKGASTVNPLDHLPNA